MKLLSLNTVVLALLVIAVTGMIVPTAAVTGGGVDQVWDQPAISLAPSSGPNGQYAAIGPDGNLSVDLAGVNVDAVTVVREVFTITNNEGSSYRLWVSHDATGAVDFFVGGSRSIEDAANPVVLSPGDARTVSLVVDTRGRAANEVLMTELTLHAERVVTPAPTPPPTTAPSSGPAPTTPSTPTATPTAVPTPTATPEPPVEETVEIEFDVETGESPDALATVREMNITELDTEDQLAGPRAVINRSEEAVVQSATDPFGPALRAKGADAITAVGQPINLSGTRSLIGQVNGVDSQLRIVKLVDIQVPEERRDQPGIVRITVARQKFGDTDPREATIAHKTRGGWQLLDTHVVGTSERTVTLQAWTPGFSPFAVFVQNEVRYSWTLPDGTPVEGKQVRSQFDTPGVHNVSLTVTDAFQRSDTAVYRVIVNDRPTVVIEGLANATGDGPATLRANVTNEVGNVTVTWTFADGSTTTGLSVARSLTVGETVRVVVEDEFGAEGRAEGVVGQAPAAAGPPSIGLVQFNLGLQTRLAVVGLAVILLVMGMRWLAARRYELY